MRSKCPNCQEMNRDNNYQGYCGICYEEIFLAYGDDPNLRMEDK